MKVKIFGGEAAGIDYLMRNPSARVLAGEVEMTQKIIDCLPHKQRFLSGSLNFTENTLTDQQKGEIITAFEHQACAGLERDRVCFLWVEHADKGRTELHFVIPEVDLATGKKFQPYVNKLDNQRFEAWQESVNLRYQLTSPREVERRLDPPLSNRIPKQKRAQIADLQQSIAEKVRQKEFQNREQILKFCQGKGFTIERAGKDYFTIKAPAWERGHRLRAVWAEEDFSPRQLHRLAEEQRQRRDPKCVQQEVSRLEQFAEQRLQRRTEFSQKRFVLKSTPPQKKGVYVRPATSTATRFAFQTALRAVDDLFRAVGITGQSPDQPRDHLADVLHAIERVGKLLASAHAGRRIRPVPARTFAETSRVVNERLGEIGASCRNAERATQRLAQGGGITPLSGLGRALAASTGRIQCHVERLANKVRFGLSTLNREREEAQRNAVIFREPVQHRPRQGRGMRM
jgi:hypothetical protein